MNRDEEHGFGRGDVPEHLRADASTTVFLLEILRLLYAIKGKVELMSAELQPKIDEIEANVTLLVTASGAAEALLNGLHQLLLDAIAAAAAAGATPAQLAKLTDLSTTIGTEAAELAAAVEANTPGA